MIIVSSIGKKAFRQLLPPQGDREGAFGAEVEWFADRDETILGTVGFDAQGKGWNYAILKRESPRGFQVRARQSHFPTHHTARVMLLRQMIGAEPLVEEQIAA